MANDSVGLGTFIPNSAGLPKILSLPPAERAQLEAAEKAAKSQLQDPVQTVRETQEEERSKAPVVQPVSGLGVTVTIDV